VLGGKACSEELETTARLYGWEESDCEWERVIARKDIQVVDISTPGYLHHDMAIAAAQAGKHIICEKPLANSLEEAKEMLQAAEKAGVKHYVNFNYRRVPAVAFAKSLIEAGRIGDPYHYHGAYLQDWIMDPNFPLVWRLKKSIAGSGVLGDLGTHIIDLGRFLIGDIDSTVGMTKTFIQERPLLQNNSNEKKRGKVDVDDAFIALLRFKSGVIGSVEASRFCAGRKNFQRIEIHGTEGSLSFNLERLNELDYYSSKDGQERRGFKTISATESVHAYAKNWWPPGHVLGWEHPMVHEMYHFFSAVAEDKTIEPWGATFYDGLMADKVTDAISKSTATEKWETVT